MTNKKYHTVGTIPKSNIKIVERVKLNTPNTPLKRKYQIAHLPWLMHLECYVSSNQKSSNQNKDISNNNGIITFFQHAEFEWEKQIQSTLLASFFYGYIITQIPGGWLADRYGGKRVFGVAMAIACACTLLTPICARTSVILVYCIRGILGLVTVSIFIHVSYHTN
jgi:Na+/melibiose symporter-like transporter